MIDIILSVFNISNRGYERIDNLLFSLSLQRAFFNQVIIVDGGHEFKSLRHITQKYNFCLHFPHPQNEFNKPVLLNEGIKVSCADHIFITDCDYIFSADLLHLCEKEVSDDHIMFKEVYMLPRTKITEQRIMKWDFFNLKKNQWGKLANGAMQLASREFFLKNPYPEEMSGFGAMDNIMAYIAVNNGLKIKWLEGGIILHQWHPVFKFRTKEDNWKFKRNQYVLEKYKSDNKLPKLL